MSIANNNFELEGFVEQKKALEALMMSNPETEKKVQNIIRKVLREAQKRMQQNARTAIGNDPRQAYKAVRMAVYKRILGGNINILNRKRAKMGGSYTPTRTLRTGQRGGNRRERSERTKNLESYFGADRGFILRFLNAGTQDRFISFSQDSSRESIHRGARGGNVAKYGETINTGRRGNIKAINWFGDASHAQLEKGAEDLSKMIDDMIESEFNK